jgi:hypothetical protein
LEKTNFKLRARGRFLQPDGTKIQLKNCYKTEVLLYNQCHGWHGTKKYEKNWNFFGWKLSKGAEEE